MITEHRPFHEILFDYGVALMSSEVSQSKIRKIDSFSPYQKALKAVEEMKLGERE